MPDIFPEYDFQVGATPEYAEKAREQQEVINKYSKENTAQTPQPPPFDAKWRYFYNIGDVMEDIKTECQRTSLSSRKQLKLGGNTCSMAATPSQKWLQLV